MSLLTKAKLKKNDPVHKYFNISEKRVDEMIKKIISSITEKGSKRGTAQDLDLVVKELNITDPAELIMLGMLYSKVMDRAKKAMMMQELLGKLI